MAGELVLITGVTGFIGFHIVLEALSAGYSVRATVRKSAQVDAIKSTKYVQPYLKNLDIVIVPDITVSGAFDEALKGVVYVIHAASPLPLVSEDVQRDVIDPAVKGTTTMLACAAKVPSVKRVVITSSILAIISLAAPPTKPITEDDSVPRPFPPWGNHFQAYATSKVLSLYTTQDWMTENKPGFDIINMMPTFVLGANKLLTNVEELVSGIGGGMANTFILNPVLGKKGDPVPGSGVHVDDVAKAHVRALSPAVTGNQSFLLTSSIQGINWDDASEIARRIFPSSVEKGLFSLAGSTPAGPSMIDASKAEEQLGIKFKPYEEMSMLHLITLTKLAIAHNLARWRGPADVRPGGGEQLFIPNIQPRILRMQAYNHVFSSASTSAIGLEPELGLLLGGKSVDRHTAVRNGDVSDDTIYA